MKKLLKGEGSNLSEGGQVLSRSVPSAVLTDYTAKIAGLEAKVKEAVRNEKDMNEVEAALRDAERAENILRFDEEINARPARTWHQTEAQKKQVRIKAKQSVDEEKRQVKEEGARTKDSSSSSKGQGILSAVEKARKMALEDEYGPVEVSKHSVSRKKRRRLEALSASNGTIYYTS